MKESQYPTRFLCEGLVSNGVTYATEDDHIVVQLVITDIDRIDEAMSGAAEVVKDFKRKHMEGDI